MTRTPWHVPAEQLPAQTTLCHCPMETIILNTKWQNTFVNIQYTLHFTQNKCCPCIMHIHKWFYDRVISKTCRYISLWDSCFLRIWHEDGLEAGNLFGKVCIKIEHFFQQIIYTFEYPVRSCIAFAYIWMDNWLWLKEQKDRLRLITGYTSHFIWRLQNMFRAYKKLQSELFQHNGITWHLLTLSR